jgi:hypothetical protein
MFACPTPPESMAEGGSDENPILLPDVTCEEFEVLLQFFYDRYVHVYDHQSKFSFSVLEHYSNIDCRTYEQGLLSLEELVKLLSISTRFDFEKARQLAIKSIGKQKLRPIDFILLAERYDVVQWLRPAYTALCMRPAPLELEEVKELGFEKIVLLAKAREKRCQSRWGLSVDEIGVIVDEIFFPPHNNVDT